MPIRKFKITKAEVGSWSTDFSIKDLDHSNPANSMSPEAFFHHIGGLAGKHLGSIAGMEFEVILPVIIQDFKDGLDLCGKTIKSGQSPERTDRLNGRMDHDERNILHS